MINLYNYIQSKFDLIESFMRNMIHISDEIGIIYLDMRDSNYNELFTKLRNANACGARIMHNVFGKNMFLYSGSFFYIYEWEPNIQKYRFIGKETY